MEKSDHISLTLSASLVGGHSADDTIGGAATTTLTRKSLRRSWNQLPRCQRNLIILVVLAACLTSLLYLSSESFATVNEKELAAGGAFPFQDERNAAEDVGLSSNRLTGDREGDVSAGTGSVSGAAAGVGDSLGDTAASAQAQGPQFKLLNLNRHDFAAQQGNNVENVVNLPETQNAADAAHKADESLTANRISIQEANLQSNNNIEAPQERNADHEQDQNDNQDSADAQLMPGSRHITIDAFLKKHLDATNIAQKQHFHGPTNERQSAVVDAFKHSWQGYKKYAWGHDNLKPLSQTAHDWFGLGLTIIDSLDTIYIMGLEDEFAEGRDWVRDFLSFDVNRDVNLFEVTIRVLGGLLSSYHLSGDTVFLKKAIELGNRLLPSFRSPSGIPYSDVNLASMSAHSPKWSPDSSTSEVTTIQLEFRDLSRITSVSKYEWVVNSVNEKVHALEKNNGLVPIFINANTGTFRNYATVSLGARGDSYYEYLLKQWLQTGRNDNDNLILDYMAAIDGVLSLLMRRTPKEHHVYLGELINGKDFKPKMDHLTCYLPGTLLLGHKYGMPESHLVLALDLLETCYQTYMRQPTQLAPEISYFAVGDSDESDIYVKPNDAHNLLRPEFIESLYYFYALTGNRTYQDMGWIIFQAFEKHTKVANGYTSIGNVKNIFNTRLRDMMESFWLGETLKYFYLLFSDNRKEFDLDKWVFNTEAHPLPVRNH